MSDVKETFKERIKRITAWLGNTHVTQSVQDLIVQSSHEELANLFYRHAIGDWGLVSDDDWQSNNEALNNNGRVVSSYLFAGVKVWIITEANRTRTTALLPSEY